MQARDKANTPPETKSKPATSENVTVHRERKIFFVIERGCMYMFCPLALESSVDCFSNVLCATVEHVLSENI